MAYSLLKGLGSSWFVIKPSRFCTLFYAYSKNCSYALPSSLPESSHLVGAGLNGRQVQSTYLTRESDLDLIVRRVRVGSSVDEVFRVLKEDDRCNAVVVSQTLVDKLLHRFRDDWKSALGVFRWAGSFSGNEHTLEAYSMVVDILGKARQMDQMRALLDEMSKHCCVTTNTVAKVMRRFAGAGQWKDAVRLFDELESFGLKKNTETMNILLDTLCKENRVEQAREIFLDLKPYIAPNAHTFNIFIHGWCKINRVDEADWTIQEMKGHGCAPSVISYSTIIQFYCRQYNFNKIYELLDKMKAQGCPPNRVTYTTVMSYLTKSQLFEEAIQIAERMKMDGCKPDVYFFNAYIHTLRQSGQVQEALHAFEVELPSNGLTPNTSTYNTMIAMFCQYGQIESALNLMTKMENTEHCKPDLQTFYPLLKYYFKTGRSESSISQMLNDMVNKHHLSFDVSIYTLLVHGFCKLKKFSEAYCLFEEMIDKEMKPKSMTCHLLLDQVKQTNMYDAAAKIEDILKKL